MTGRFTIKDVRMPKNYSSSDLISMVKADGWFIVNTTGSHHQFKHPSKKGTVVIPHPKKDIPVGTANSILKQAGL
ncbi:addiction module toxin, HicA family protein [Spirochaetia bacterium]|nr:addiction module toxin, HicA family protein [Spirochaetia bacterium]